MIIEEEIGAENLSPEINSKRSKNSKISTINFETYNSNISNNNNNNAAVEDLKSSNKLNTEPEKQLDVIIIPNTFKRTLNKKNSLKYVNTYFDDQNYENLAIYYNTDIYQNYIIVLYTNLFEWLLNKKDGIEENFIDYRYTIVNEYIIEIFIKFCNLRQVNLIQRFFQETHLLLANNKGNTLNKK